MKGKRKIAALLSMLFLLSVVVGGCTGKSTPQNNPHQAKESDSDKSKDSSKTNDADSKKKSGQKEASNPHIKDAVFKEKPMDLEGREIKFLSGFPNRWRKNPEEGTSTPNAVLEVVDSLAEIEKDYNCKITVEEIKGRDLVARALTEKAAGNTLGDILAMDITGSQMESLYSENIVMDLTDNKIINLKGNSWLPQTEFAHMFGKQFGVHFLAKGSTDVLRGVMVFNKTLAEKYGLPDIYNLVKTKKWTFEEFRKCCETITSKAGGEVYPIGYSQEGIFTPLFVFANNGTYVNNTPKGYQFDPLQENTLEANNFVVDLLKAGYVYPHPNNDADEDQLFMDGKYVFYCGNYSAQSKYRTNMADEYGMIPVPMGPKATDYCVVTYNDSIFHIFNNIEKPDEVAAVLVAIANRCSKKNILKDEMMTELSDEESAEIFEMLYANVKCDLSRVVSTVRGKIKTANTQILQLETTPSEVYESIKPEVQGLLDQVIFKGK